MTQWNPSKHPSQWPASWHEAIRERASEVILGWSTDKTTMELFRRKFNAFKASLRAWPRHPTAKALAKLDTRMRLRRERTEWVLYLVKKPKLVIPDTVDGAPPEDMRGEA